MLDKAEMLSNVTGLEQTSLFDRIADGCGGTASYFDFIGRRILNFLLEFRIILKDFHHFFQIATIFEIVQLESEVI